MLKFSSCNCNKMLPNISEEEIIKTFKVNALSNILIAKSIITIQTCYLTNGEDLYTSHQQKLLGVIKI